MLKQLNSKKMCILLLAVALTLICLLLYELTNQSQEKFYQGISVIKFKTTSETLPLAQGASKKLSVTVLPYNANNKKLDWTSSNPAIVSVESDGTLKGISIGNAVITAKTTDGSDLLISQKVRVYNITQSKVRFIAHRGFSAMAPENTLAAFNLAGDFGFWGSECDIWETNSGNLYVMHDYSLLRMCGVDKPIVEVKPKELKRYTITGGKNLRTYPNETIPTFEEYLDVFSNYPNLHPVIEIKNLCSEEALKKIIFMLERYQLKEKAYIISPFRTNLIYLRTNYTDLNLQFISKAADNSAINFCIEYSLDLSCYHKNLTANKVKKLHDNGLKVSIWTVDSKDLAHKYMKDLKVDFITTNQCLFFQ